MMVVMHKESTEEEINNVVYKIENVGLHSQISVGADAVVIAAIGDADLVRELDLETMNNVDKVVAISNPYKLASLEFTHNQYSVFNINNRLIGGDNFTIIQGPCTVESKQETLETAHIVKASNASMFRGGAFKPRTSPFAFQGLGLEALDILAQVKSETGLPIVTELMDITYINEIIEVADVIQIGARNMQNYSLLSELGSINKTVLLKRGLSSTLPELLQAADYILKEGNEKVILCERGIRTFDSTMRFTLDLGAVVWLKAHTHLPVIVDPSHAAGNRNYVKPLAYAAASIGADGIIVETTINPENAQCDGPQQLYADDLMEFNSKLYDHAELANKIPSF